MWPCMLRLLSRISSLLISTFPVHSPAFFPKPLSIFLVLAVFAEYKLAQKNMTCGMITCEMNRSISICRLTEERQILNRWTEYCSELYNYKANGDPSVLNCTQTDTEDDHPNLCREVEAEVQSLKRGKSDGVDNIPAELVQAGGEDVITALTTICNRI